MSPVVKRKREKFTIPSKYLLFTLTLVCSILIVISLFTPRLENVIDNTIGNVVIPFQKGFSSVGNFLDERYFEFTEISRLLEENDLLQQEINELELEISRLQQDKYELVHLQQLFELDQQYESYEKVGARIISASEGNWFYSFTIDKGSDDGILEGMNVIADGGLVGLVSKVGSNWSQVTAIIADTSNISAQILSTEENFIVTGSLSGMKTDGTILFTQLLDDGQLQVGDKIVTSHISDKYLPGLVIGYIATIEQDANNMTKSGTVLPNVDFHKLDEVLVITTMKEEIEE
ncbi:MAG: rod shape-determining protein MreC [Lachnospiraceae bacterium]